MYLQATVLCQNTLRDTNSYEAQKAVVSVVLVCNSFYPIEGN